MRLSCAALLSSSARLLLHNARLPRGPIPFDISEEPDSQMVKLKAASAAWRVTLAERLSKHPPPPAPPHTDRQSASRLPSAVPTHITQVAPSTAFLEAEALWRSLPPRRLWAHFQDIAWALHGEVDRLAFHGGLGGRSDLVFVLFRGSEFAGGDAGGLCTGLDEAGRQFRPFAVIGISQEVHSHYLVLKESLLHELAHWAAHRTHGPWQALGPSEVSTSGHGDYWHDAVARIQAVFGDFVGFRSMDASRLRATTSGGHVDAAVFSHTFLCAACGVRARYTSRRRNPARHCTNCYAQALTYIGEYDAFGEPYPGQHNATWHAVVAQHGVAAYERAAQRAPTAPVRDLLSEALQELAKEMRAATTSSRSMVSTSADSPPGPEPWPSDHTEGNGEAPAAAHAAEDTSPTLSTATARLHVHALSAEAAAGIGVGSLSTQARAVPAAVAAAPRLKRSRKQDGAALAGAAAAGVQPASRRPWPEYVRAAWPMARERTLQRNRQRKHPLPPKALCSQVMRTIARWWRDDKARLAAAQPPGAAGGEHAARVHAMQHAWLRFGDRPWARLQHNDDLRALITFWQ
eukprot:jgi/Ulvmu1/390/UM001_0397.1